MDPGWGTCNPVPPPPLALTRLIKSEFYTISCLIADGKSKSKDKSYCSNKLHLYKEKFLPGDGVVYFRNQTRKIRSVAFSW